MTRSPKAVELVARALCVAENRGGVWQDFSADAISLLDAVTPLDPLGAVAMKTAAYDSLFRHPGFFHAISGQTFKAVKLEDAAEGIFALPLPTHADRLAAALELPEIARLVEAAKAWRRSTLMSDTHSFRDAGEAFSDALFAIAALSPADSAPGETDSKRDA